GRPLVAVRVVEGDPSVERWNQLAARLPCVVVGVASGPVTSDAAVRGFDILLAGGAEAPAPWVACADGTGTALAQLDAAAERSPQAAVTLAQLLRVGPLVSVDDALVLESLAYSTLQ